MICNLDQTEKINSKEYIITNIDIIPISSSPILKGFIHIKEGKIKNFGSTLDPSFLTEPYKVPVYDGSNYKVLPSFINSHTHSAMSFFRGLGCFLEGNTDKSSSMIENFLFPAEKSLSFEDVEIFSMSYLIDGIKTGSSCFCDHYYFIDAVIKSMEALGVRGVVGQTLCDLNGAFLTGKTEWEQIKKSIHEWSFSTRISPILAPHASDTISRPFLTSIIDFAKEENLGIHIHLSQTQGERERTLNREGLSPVKFLGSCGGLYDKAVLVHMLSADSEDLKEVEDNEATICLCPSSEILYESAPGKTLLDSNIQTIVGTDCAASQDSANILGEIKTLSLLSKMVNSSKYINANSLLQTVTTLPSKVFNLNCGSIEVGKYADLTYIRKDISTACDFKTNMESNLIYSSNDRFIEHLSVEGKFILWNREITKKKKKSVMEEVYKKFEKLVSKCGLDK